jgi:hypothetical protein
MERMNDQDDFTPQTDDPLVEVDELGGDADIMESLPEGGSPIETETEYDRLEAELEDEADDESEPGEDQSPQEMRADYDPDDPYYMPAPERSDAYEDFLDIDAALASVASLSDVIAEREAAELAEIARRQEREAAREEVATRRPPRAMSVPPATTLRRGQMASVVPALLLMGVGAWLTFAQSAPGVLPLTPALAAGVLAGALIITLLAQWLHAKRWSRGVFFFAALALLVGVSYVFSTLAPNNAVMLPPLLLLSAALAFALTGLLSRPADRHLMLPAALFAAAAVIALLAALGIVPDQILAGAAPLWPVVVAALAVIWLLPVVLRRRG